MVFEQTDTDGYFILDRAETYASPDPPQVGTTLNVRLSGQWQTTLTLDHIDTLMHNVIQKDRFSQKDVEDVNRGEDWSLLLKYEIPSIATLGQWSLDMEQFDASGTPVFSVSSGWYWP